MSLTYSFASQGVLLSLSALSCLAQVQLQSPVRELARSQESAVGGAGFTEIHTSSANFRTAALVSVKTDNNGAKTNVDRGTNVVSAVYAGASLPNALPSTPPAATSSAPPSTQKFDFKKSGDSAQAWATMSPTGAPFLLTRAFGKATASGTATWMAQVAVPASQTHMYVRFTLPAIQVTGVNEADGPSRYQSRFRADLLLNGHPVWNSEAIRFNEFSSTPGYCNVKSELGTRFESFGTAPSGLSSTVKTDLSALNSVTLSLGSFTAGQWLELSLVVRADTSVESRCCKQDNELFCTGASTLVDWDSSVATPVRFWAGPAV